jgi:hypothetical protein
MSNDHGLGYMMSYVKIISKALQGRASYSETVTQCHSVASAEESLSRTFDTFDGAKPRFSNRGQKRRSVSTLSIPRAIAWGVEWVDFMRFFTLFRMTDIRVLLT